MTTSEQFAQIQKAAFETFQTVALKYIESFEKLAELHLQATKASLTESTDQIKALLAAKDPKALADIAMSAAQPATDKFASYAKQVYEIANETGTEIAKLFEKQVAESNQQFSSVIDTMAKNAPAGSESFVSFVKSAVSAANTAFEQVNKATKQAVELAEANIVAASKAAPRVARKTVAV
ncbi:MAG: phasin family protein [Burkholderiaceae bacterium]